MRKTRGGWGETGRHRRHRPLSQVVRVLISLLISSHYVYYLRAWHRLMISKLSDSKVVFEDFFDFYREREKTKKWKAFEWENFADKS